MEFLLTFFNAISWGELLLHLLFLALFVAWLLWYALSEEKRMGGTLLKFGSSKNMARILRERSRSLNYSQGRSVSSE